ncbi:hypothetical protein [Aminipila luticellarii]|uniref:Uncharacterized protein n=1 Tax=Aminipila luticellarii TaxID=2507160 RepID=A0A410PW14_9FIRM|nr:hypothetical protein [Aminipila luticellarii]QAT43090.1 hypothetical protein EQM06_07490 [Aminipila luticellarii]
MKAVKVLQGSCIPESTMNLIFQSRTAWRDMAIWLNFYINSKHGEIGDKGIIREKIEGFLIQNPNVFYQVFGIANMDEFVKLLLSFLDYVDLLIEAQITGDDAQVTDYTRNVQGNADQIAVFLASINPYWQQAEWEELLGQFNQLVIQLSTTRLAEQYEENIEILNKMLNLTIRIGDYYSQGILDYLVFSNRATMNRCPIFQACIE